MHGNHFKYANNSPVHLWCCIGPASVICLHQCWLSVSDWEAQLGRLLYLYISDGMEVGYWAELIKVIYIGIFYNVANTDEEQSVLICEFNDWLNHLTSVGVIDIKPCTSEMLFFKHGLVWHLNVVCMFALTYWWLSLDSGSAIPSYHWTMCIARRRNSHRI